MLLNFVLLYLFASIAVGLYAAQRVKTSTDYVVAGHKLPLYMTIATVFATWFGSETVLGAPATFIEGGLGSIVADPFGASLCLILVGLFFARPLYRMKLLTLGDFYRRQYGRTVEVVVSMAICISYLGWVAAQIMALGLVFHMLTGGAVPMTHGMAIGMGIVLLYTLYGGMWSVAMTDFMQMIIIVVGLLIISVHLSNAAGGADVVLAKAAEDGRLSNFFPEWTLAGVLTFIGALVTMGLGSIPQQDVFQRVTSANSEQNAARGAIWGGFLYLGFAMIPLFLICAALVIDPIMVQNGIADDSQKILPSLILTHTPLWIQVLFFGALLSAIMSTASGTLLAPSVTFAENILRGMLPKMNDAQLLKVIRCTVVGFAGIILIFATNSELTIFEMVKNAYTVTLVGAFTPLVAGIYWKRANTAGATLSIIFGVGTWLTMDFVAPEGICPPQLAGLVAAFIGMALGGYYGKPDHVDPNSGSHSAAPEGAKPAAKAKQGMKKIAAKKTGIQKTKPTKTKPRSKK
jgi:SSS family solute:Na+ symporter